MTIAGKKINALTANLIYDYLGSYCITIPRSKYAIADLSTGCAKKRGKIICAAQFMCNFLYKTTSIDSGLMADI
jgi:hypothetical protein